MGMVVTFFVLTGSEQILEIRSVLTLTGFLQSRASRWNCSMLILVAKALVNNVKHGRMRIPRDMLLT